MRDPYQVLGVDRSASEAEIKSAYRKLAKKLHPDVNQGRKDIEQKFKEVTAAYDLISDPTKRAKFDRGEIDAMGNDRGFSFRDADPFGRGGPRGRTYNYSSSGSATDPFSFAPEDIFAEFFGGGSKRGGPRGGTPRGQDISYTLNVSFTEACLGGKRRVSLANDKTIEIQIPPGTDNGHKLRLRGQGMPGRLESGDAIIDIHVEPHALFTRQLDDLHIELPISLSEALLGAQIKVPTLEGHVSVKVPKGANAGTILRLKGKGVPRAKNSPGDMFVKIKIALPDNPDNDLTDFIEKWSKKKPYDPRKGAEWK
ncbi:MAG: J domain-containing protein [Alphaproteobacteria bacterium]|nr:J domain-containing protein [Alphaproteobacteria bacterium]